MERDELKKQLIQNHERFITMLEALNANDFNLSKNGKWTAGQQLEHIYLAVKPVKQALRLPKFLLKFFFGLTNRPGRTYAELVAKYQQKLAKGGRATGRFMPKPVAFSQRATHLAKLKREVKALCEKLERFKEEDLNLYVLPHPLLGKLTLREMMYFTIYHVEHHEFLTKQNLGTD